MAQIQIQLETEVVQRALVASGRPVRIDGICGRETYEEFTWFVSTVIVTPTTTEQQFTWSCSGRSFTLMGEEWQVRQVAQVVADFARSVPRRRQPVATSEPDPVDQTIAPIRRPNTGGIVVGALLTAGLLGAGAYVMLGGKKNKRRGKKKRKKSRARRTRQRARSRRTRRGRRR